MRKPENLIKELIHLKRRYGIKAFYFRDPTFSLGENRIKKIAHLMIKNNINLKRLAKETEGMSGADIRAVCTESGYLAIRTNRKLIELADFLKSIDKVRKNDLGEASGMFG